MKRKNLFVAASFLMATAMTACGGGGGSKIDLKGDYTFKVWCAEEIVDLTKGQLETYKTTLEEGINITFEVAPVSESSAAGDMINDVEAGADIFCFAQDQLARLVSAGALDKITGNVKKEVEARNDGGSVAAATYAKTLRAFPLTSDNGYFMYYDKSVITNEADLEDMSALIATVKAANKLIAFNGTSAWYNAAYFFGAGCESTWSTNEEGKFDKYVDTYNSDKGLVAMKGMAELINSGVYTDSSSAPSSFASGAAVVISGTWDYENTASILGENIGCTDLPSYTVGGKSYHLGSFGGFKLMGVKPQTTAQRTYLVKQIASYLTNESCQLARFNAKAWGPSNLNAQKSEAVKANPGLAALALQSAYAVPQGQYPDPWWNHAGALASDIKTAGAGVTDAALKDLLANYAKGLDGFLEA